MRSFVILAGLAIILLADCCRRSAPPPPPPSPVHDIDYSVLDQRQTGIFLTYPGVNTGNASAFWTSPLDSSQRGEFAGGTQAIEEVEKAHKWRAIAGVTKIHGNEPNSPSEKQFNVEVVWDTDAPSHFAKLPHWTEHIALLHPGQYGYQENRDENPFLGLVVLFDENPSNPSQPGGQFHIGFRSWFGHYEPENGDIVNPENYELYATWYGYIDSYVPP
jgi:hypothetical protein